MTYGVRTIRSVLYLYYVRQLFLNLAAPVGDIRSNECVRDCDSIVRDKRQRGSIRLQGGYSLLRFMFDGRR